MGWTRKSSASQKVYYKGQHRFEHWYRSNQVYFITARCRGKFSAFQSENAKQIFWDRFTHYTSLHGFDPWLTSLLHNHYHTLGYLQDGEQLGSMMRQIHGSVAKLVNDTLHVRLVPFWVDAGHQDYFDGCIRDAVQFRRAYRYVLLQCRRHGVCYDWRDYAHTRMVRTLEEGLALALERKAFLEGVPYKRYQRGSAKREPGH